MPIRHVLTAFLVLLVSSAAACSSDKEGESTPMGVTRVSVLDARELRLEVTAAGPMCFEVTSVEVNERPDRIGLLVSGGRRRDCGITDDRGEHYRTRVELAASLGEREVVDEACPDPRPIDGEGGCDLQIEVVREPRAAR